MYCVLEIRKILHIVSKFEGKLLVITNRSCRPTETNSHKLRHKFRTLSISIFRASGSPSLKMILKPRQLINNENVLIY